MLGFLEALVGIGDAIYRLVFQPRRTAVLIASGWLLILILGDADWWGAGTKRVALACLVLWCWGWFVDTLRE